MPGEPESASAERRSWGARASWSLRRNIGHVAAASAVALVFGELVTFGQTVALARLLSPAEVGVFVAGPVLTSFLGNFVEGGLRSGTRPPKRRSLRRGRNGLLGDDCLGFALDHRRARRRSGHWFGLRRQRAVGFQSPPPRPVCYPQRLLQRSRIVVAARVTCAASADRRAVGLNSICDRCSLTGRSGLGRVEHGGAPGLYASHIVWVATLWLITDWRPGRGHASVRLWRELARYGLPLVIGMFVARIYALIESVVVGRGLSEAALGNYRYGQRIAMIPQKIIIEDRRGCAVPGVLSDIWRSGPTQAGLPPRDPLGNHRCGSTLPAV